MDDQIAQMNPELNGLVARGIAALRAGQRRAARRWFAQAVRQEPRNATAWYWLSRSVEDGTQRQECLERVRQLDRARSPAQDGSAAGAPRGTSRWRAGLLRYALAALLLLSVCAAVPLFRWQAAAARSGPDPLAASGMIQADQVAVASEYGGRIARIAVQEGEAVTAGQLLVQLDTSMLDAQIEAAQAAVDLAQAGLDQARAGARPGQIAVAEAQVAQALAARAAASQAVTDTLALVQNPQEIEMQIAVMQAQIRSAQLDLEQALALKDAAAIAKDEFSDAQHKIMDAGGPGKHRIQVPGAPPGVYVEYTVPSLPLDMHLVPNQWWQAWVGVNMAAAQKEGLEAALANLNTQRDDPQDLKARADAAIAGLAQAEAQVRGAQAQLDALRAGMTPEQLDALQARVAQRRAALEALRSQRTAISISAPIAGVVTSLAAHEGEVAAPGATLVLLADLARVKLTVYLPETEIGGIALGQRAQVTVDSFPGRTFEGQVTHVADQAEFTPRNVTTQEERVNLVFAIEIGIDNPDGALKPGMPADATFQAAAP
jgi:HlyD family secretion protein